MNEKCKCGHDKDNHYLGTEGCAICYKVDKYLCTKYEPMNENNNSVPILEFRPLLQGETGFSPITKRRK